MHFKIQRLKWDQLYLKLTSPGTETKNANLFQRFIQKSSHFKTASNSFQSKTWKRCGNTVLTRSRSTTTPNLWKVRFKYHICKKQFFYIKP